MDGLNIDDIVKQAVRQYIATSQNDAEVRALAKIMAREALEQAISVIDDSDSA